MAQDLLTSLGDKGIRLRLADDGGLQVIAPPGALTPALRTALQERRDELLGLLRAGSPTAEDPIRTAPGERHLPFPLTDIQHAYWVGRTSAIELGGVSTHLYFELEGRDLDHGRLTAALRKVIARHDMLRSVVRPDGSQCVVADLPDYEIDLVDLRALDPAVAVARIEAIRAEMDHQVLPAHRWPLFDIRAARVSDTELRLFVSFDILILDGLSMYLVFREWRRFYEEPDWSPPALELSYRDYVLYEERLREGARYREAEEYWLDRVATLPPAPSLPLAKHPSQIAETRCARRAGSLPAGLWASVKANAAAHGVTPSAVLMTAFADVLRHWSAQPDLTLNLTLFNRPAGHPEITSVVGDFTSLTMLEVRDPGRAPFAGRAGAVQRQLLRDLEHTAYSGVRVQRERAKALGRASAGMPVVFTSALVLGGDGDPAEDIRFFGERVNGITQTPQVWLDHQVAEERGCLVFNWDSVDELFPDGLLDDMFAAYVATLERLGDADAWTAPAQAPALPARQAAERRAANDTAAPEDTRTLCELVEQQALRTPDAVAVIAEDAERTYRDTVAEAHRLAARLADLGAQPNTLVAVVLPKGFEQVAAVLGVTRSGAAYLPIDPSWPEARRTQLLAAGDVRIAVTTEALRDGESWPQGTELVTFADPEVRGAAGPPATAPAPGDLAYVIYTSGSTGAPKGVMIDHRGAVNTIVDINRRFAVGEHDRVLALSALSFDLSVYDVFGTLAAGAAVVMPAPGRTAEPAHWGELVERHGVTVWNSVPALMSAWMEARAQTGAPAGAPVRLALLSGDWIPVTLPATVRAQVPGIEVVSLGGATEAAIWSVFHPIGEVDPTLPSIPYGKPPTNQTLHVYAADWSPCPVWTTGELYIGGAGVALGYFADPERTAERFVTHPDTGERLYRTGDLGRYLPGGDIEFLGRADSQVKINGYRIELGEIGAALRRQPGVADAVVHVDTHPSTGHRQLVAHVVAAGDAAAAGADLAAVAAAAEREQAAADADLADDLTAYTGMLDALEQVSGTVIARTLARLGVFGVDGATATAAGIVADHGLKPGYVGLVRRWLDALVEDGVLTRGPAQDEVRAAVGLDAAELDTRLKRELAAVPVTRPAHQVLADYFGRCVDNQVEMLRGEVSPLRMLLPDNDWTTADALYAGNPVAQARNRVAAAAVRSAAEGRPGRPTRVLEVGAGTGATTAHVLAAVPDDVRYTFTDVSTYFTQRAKETFSGHGFVDYGVFDIDRDPAVQGFPAASADVVVAANVLHDAKDVDRTLRALGGVLAADGLLVLVEGTANRRQQMVTVGFIEGLAQDRATDRLPLLEVAEWRARLAEAGFGDVVALPEDPHTPHGQHVLLARAGGRRACLDPAGLRAQLESVLPDYMVPRHVLVVDAFPLTANGKVDVSALPTAWRTAETDDRVGPRTDVEAVLMGIWADTLKRDDFGVTDDFFELGGDSLHAVSILGRLQQEFGLDDDGDEGLEMLFDNPTIAELAEALSVVAGR